MYGLVPACGFKVTTDELSFVGMFELRPKWGMLELQVTLHGTDDGRGEFLWADPEKGQRPFTRNAGEPPLIL